jgi:hypothetical protein
MMMKVIGAAALGLMVSVGSAAAEDRGAADLVGLFQQSCLAFTGQTGKLREWAASKKLPEMPARNAKALAGSTAGKVYNASQGDEKLAVVSQDDGGCRAILGYGDQGAVDDALKGLFRKVNAQVKTLSSRQSGNERQIVLSVTVDGRTMRVTIITMPDPRLPSAPPRITLAAASQAG